MVEALAEFTANWKIYLLIFARMLAMFTVAPFFGSSMIPYRVRVTIALVVTIAISQMVIAKSSPIEPSQIPFLIAVIQEAIIGLGFGFLVSMVFALFQIAGQLFSLQIGFGISQYFDPLQETQASIIGQYLSLFALLVFFIIGGPELLIGGVYESYFNFPIMEANEVPTYLAGGIITLFSDVFEVAVRIAFPVISSVFMITLSLGILARFAPQLNIFILGFPIYIYVGLLTLIFIAESIYEFGGIFLARSINAIIEMLSGGG
jgi:flagellar biosynthesis protein FliR